MRKRQSFSKEGKKQKACIVGVRRQGMTRSQMDLSLEELSRLIDTAGGEVVCSIHQELKRPDPATFIGSGKVDEIAELAKLNGAEIVIVDDELTPVQNRNLEDQISLLVLDRTAVILDIFALRARTKEGKLQVELAQLEYLAPRLAGRGENFSQQTGRIGTRGPGETALESDRRRSRDRITWLKRQLEGVRSHRLIHRQKRESVPIPTVSMVGYTNAGKSTLMNRLTEAGVFVEDKLFATLDPTVRRLRLPSGRDILMADTVGFIRRLPHQLVESFRSTFEEVSSSQLLLNVVDGSDPEANSQADVVETVLKEMNLAEKPILTVVNKCDADQIFYSVHDDAIKISALRGDGVDALLKKIDDTLRTEFRKCVLKIPFTSGDVLSSLYKLGFVEKVSYEQDGILIHCELCKKHFNKYRGFEVISE